MRGVDDWKPVAAAVRARRLQLGLTQRQVAESVGLSEPTWGLIENGPGRHDELTLAKAARALGWRADSFDRLRAGERPVLANSDDGSDLVGRVEALETQVKRLRQLLGESERRR